MDFIWHYRLSVCVYLNAGPAFTLTYDLSLSLGYIATVKYMGEKKKKRLSRQTRHLLDLMEQPQNSHHFLQETSSFCW